MEATKKNNVITIEFEEHDTLQSPMLYQYDTGQKIEFRDVPDGVEVQFSNENSETTDNRILVDGQVEIPDFLISEGLEITAYIQYINDQSETTTKVLTIPIECRTKQQDIVPDEDKGAFRRQIEQIMNDTKKAAEEAADKVESNKEFLDKAEKAAEASENSANKAKEYLNATENNKSEVEKLTEAKMNDIDSIVNAKIGDINALVEAKNKGIDSLVEAKSNDIATLTTAKMEDIANVTNAKLGDINNTARAQIEAINSSAVAAGESQTKGINTVASSQISNITNITNQQLKNINTAATNQIGTIEGKTYTQIKNINDTALSQIDAINNTTTNQIKNMTVKYSDMCRTLGIEHEGIINITRYKNVSIDVRKYKYIKFGTANTKGSSFNDYTLPPKYDWCGIHCDKKEIDFTTPKPSDSIFEVTSNKEYDISTFDDLYLYYSSKASADYGYINYKLYNESEETTEE